MAVGGNSEFTAHALWDLGPFDVGKLKDESLRDNIAEINVSTPGAPSTLRDGAIDGQAWGSKALAAICY